MSSRTQRFARFHAVLAGSTRSEKTRASGWREKNHVDTNLTNVLRVNRTRADREGERCVWRRELWSAFGLCVLWSGVDLR